MSRAELQRLGEHERGSRERLGRACASLHDSHGMTWAEIGDMFSVHLTTARRLAQPYVAKPDE